MKKYVNGRINLFLIALILVSGLVLYRLFVLSILRHSVYSKTAQAQNEGITNIMARGNIYLSDKNSDTFLAATNKKFPLAYIIPDKITADKKNDTADRLAAILGLNHDELAAKINLSSDSLKVIARKINDQQVEAVKQLGLKGAGVSYENDRFYPGGELASNVIGFLGYNATDEKTGQYGIESYYDTELTGQSAVVPSLFNFSDPVFVWSELKNLFLKKTGDSVKTPSFDRPADVVLTIDKNIQFFVQQELKDILHKWNAEKGTVIVEEPVTGRILAMADWPSFDPNNYGAFSPELFLNHNVQEVYEPGSSFKPVTMTAGLDLGKITPDTSYDDVGYVSAGGYTIHNFSDKVFGHSTMTQVLEKSINTGTMFVENLIGDDNFLNYVVNMGFGQKTGVDLPGEVSGDITNLYSGRKINFLTASFGQGIAVTPLQLINAYSTIANGGKLMRPYVVDKIIKDGGEEVVTKPEVISIPMSQKTAEKLQNMLVGVVDNGFDKARIKGYDVAGKTGTAQIPDGNGGYTQDKFIHNFLGFAPAYNAKFVVLVKMDKPQGITFAADSLSPVYRDIAAFLLNYYNIPPSRK